MKRKMNLANRFISFSWNYAAYGELIPTILKISKFFSAFPRGKIFVPY